MGWPDLYRKHLILYFNMDTVTDNIRQRVSRLISDIESGLEMNIPVNLDTINYRLDSLCRDLLHFRDGLPRYAYGDISNALLSARQVLELDAAVMSQESESTGSRFQPDTNPAGGAGGVGRPKFDISEEQIRFFAGEMNCTVKEIAQCFNVSERTIKRRLNTIGLSIRRLYSEIGDLELDDRVSFILQNMPRAGYKTVDGYLISQGLRVQRQRIRDSLYRLDPERQELRTITAVRRRHYSVAMPLSLWHIDGHHKLIRWRFVTHGGIDGYSRAIVFLGCSSNNRAGTVLELFKDAVSNWGLPSRVRSDHGGENTGVAMFMLDHPLRGSGRGSFITGRSVHNCRIERLWRDLHEQDEAAEYGIDPNGHYLGGAENDGSVQIPSTVCPLALTADQMDHFNQQVRFHPNDVSVFDDTAYLQGLEVLQSFNQD
ncbi:uncharacterized protein LOC105440703 isoform X3 [Strongylocentrotus purpuratus]|uniref:Integrase core domain-containing protein n=1 Tax=Strongylocentrotus purpuratus TaxID=7668 RepID=A0A7M7PFR3_STRPU|nr:uncharacterized protein LOC105440703 isoform X3 [Strongylocentrotus purpuratus]